MDDHTSTPRSNYAMWLSIAGALIVALIIWGAVIAKRSEQRMAEVGRTESGQTESSVSKPSDVTLSQTAVSVTDSADVLNYPDKYLGKVVAMVGNVEAKLTEDIYLVRTGNNDAVLVIRNKSSAPQRLDVGQMAQVRGMVQRIDRNETGVEWLHELSAEQLDKYNGKGVIVAEQLALAH